MEKAFLDCHRKSISLNNLVRPFHAIGITAPYACTQAVESVVGNLEEVMGLQSVLLWVKRFLLRCFVVLCLLTVSTLSAQETGQQAQNLNEVLRELSSIKEELRELKSLIESQQIALPVSASRASKIPDIRQKNIVLPFVPEYAVGDGKAEFVLVEFADLQCPFCIHFNKYTLPKVKEKFVSSGQLRLMSVDFPLESHPDAGELALASICAGEQGHYWEMRDLLIDAKASSIKEAIDKAADSIPLNQTSFSTCISSKEKLKQIMDRAELARAAGVYSTPTFLLGRIKDGKISGYSIVGDLPSDEFSAKIDLWINDLRRTNNETKTTSVAQGK